MLQFANYKERVAWCVSLGVLCLIQLLYNVSDLSSALCAKHYENFIHFFRNGSTFFFSFVKNRNNESILTLKAPRKNESENVVC